MCLAMVPVLNTYIKGFEGVLGDLKEPRGFRWAQLVKIWLCDIMIRLTGNMFGHGSSSYYQLNTYWLDGLQAKNQVCQVTQTIQTKTDPPE